MICIIIRVSGHHDILLSEYLDIVATWTAVPGLMAEHNIAAVNSKQCSCCNISLVEDPPILDGGEIAQNQDINAERIERKENIQHQFCDVAQLNTCHSLPSVKVYHGAHFSLDSFFQPTLLLFLPPMGCMLTVPLLALMSSMQACFSRSAQYHSNWFIPCQTNILIQPGNLLQPKLNYNSERFVTIMII